MAIQSYKELVVWQRAMELVTAVYEITCSFPDFERFGLTAQMRRAAVSIPSNIAEGQGRGSTGEFKHFLGNARGSLYEVETQLLIARNLNYISKEMSEPLLGKIQEVGRLMLGLIRSLDDRNLRN